MTFFILLLMIFLHIWDDFGRQGIMASMKQKSWWTSQPEFSSMYSYDYVVALFMHSFSWSFMIMLPIFVMCAFKLTALHYAFFIGNLILHMLIDDAKANRRSINLVIDQSLHMYQIVTTWIAFNA